MAWNTEMVILLRHMVGDISSPYKYSDARLQQLIAASAQLVKSDTTLFSGYTIDIMSTGISPDPTTASPKDDGFINLSVTKAACIIDNSEARIGGGKSVRMQDGDKEIDARDLGQHVIEIWKRGWCVIYNDLKFNVENGDGQLGQAVIGPFRQYAGGYSSYWSPDDCNALYEGRYRECLT